MMMMPAAAATPAAMAAMHTAAGSGRDAAPRAGAASRWHDKVRVRRLGGVHAWPPTAAAAATCSAAAGRVRRHPVP